ncbi:MAG TPA: NADPH-dependent F420 reductase [Euzebyales bacterium]|nr:NADPH-dependent F420 reductase [Euzebyales bacterium]
MTVAHRVGVLGGTGPLGRGLGLRLAQAGHPVVLGSREARRAQAAADELRAEHGVAAELLRGAGNDDAAAADVVVVAVPFDGVEPTLGPLATALAGKVVVSCVNRLAFDDLGPRPEPVEAGSAAELVARLLPDSRVVGAFHHVPAGRMRRGAGTVDMDVLVTGDDDDACATAAALADAIPGMRAVRAGPLRLTRPLEELTAVLVAVNRRYRTTAGVRVTGLPEAG